MVRVNRCVCVCVFVFLPISFAKETPIELRGQPVPQIQCPVVIVSTLNAVMEA